ncbi:MAG: pilus assembly protein PilM [Lachnospiraceae bacterium]|nr:pilus assembly protein PilM [Lachnospiraceae bacterium]
MIEVENEREYVFSLDIGTRNVVGTVGYKDEDDNFKVIALYSIEHESRAMLDGQIHDIGRVSKTIGIVKEKLEEQIGFELKEVCIAAAGRVLRTVTTKVAYEFPEETVVTGEDLNNLDLLGIDQAQHELAEGDERYKFYCVGYSVMKYFLNEEVFSNLEGHKANKIEEIIIVTFLPEDVVDGLYSAVERVGLSVANMTLEPIAAINVAIPENFRMLNIALVDVGAGTSDICITKDGSIIAYGMIPYAGDELTEVIVQQFLVDFATAEQIKKDSTIMDEVTYEDIMGLSYTVKAEEVWKLTDPIMEKITTEVATKIKELNGDASVAATFVVGGGGKVHGFCETLAKKLDIMKERVALRGEEVMKEVEFLQEDVKKDPLLVTPIGICLNYYEQKNNFIMIHFNGEMMKLYDNGHLRIVDAAMQAGVPTEELFPRRGAEINFKVNGVSRMARGGFGESAVVKMNGQEVGLKTKLIPNCDVTIEGSTEGTSANMTIDQLDEFQNSTVSFVVNGQRITCPKFVEVNGSLEPGSYIIKEGDDIETRGFYTVGQLAEFMDVTVDKNHEIIVNNRVGDLNTLVYENFSVEWTEGAFVPVTEDYLNDEEEEEEEAEFDSEAEENVPYRPNTPLTNEAATAINKQSYGSIHLKANGQEVTLSGQKDYIFSDIFRVIDFDTNVGGGRTVITTINGNRCGYADPIHDGDDVDIHWSED